MSQKDSKKEHFAKKFADDLSDLFQLSGEEIVCIVILVALLAFFVTDMWITTEFNEPSRTLTVHQGFPFESLRKTFTFQNASEAHNPFHGYFQPTVIVGVTVEIAWSGLAMNLMIYALFSFSIVKAIAKTKEKIYCLRYDKETQR